MNVPLATHDGSWLCQTRVWPRSRWPTAVAALAIERWPTIPLPRPIRQRSPMTTMRDEMPSWSGPQPADSATWPEIIVFACHYCAYAAADLAGSMRLQICDELAAVPWELLGDARMPDGTLLAPRTPDVASEPDVAGAAGSGGS